MSVPVVFLGQLFIRKSAAFSGYSLLVYDYLITFPLEVKYIWNAPWTAVKVGFLLNRYGNLAGQTFFVMEETGYLSHGSRQFCRIFGPFCSIFMLFSGESIRILVLMRAWTIWGCTRRITVILIALYIFYVLALLPLVIYPLTLDISTPFPYLEQVGICAPPIISFVWLLWFAILALDTVVLVIVGHSLWKLFKESHDLFPSPLIHLLVRDGILFYVVSMFNNVFSMICWTLFRLEPRSFLQLALSFPFISVIGQRLILNLRGFRERPFTARDVSREVDRQLAAIGELLWPDIEVEDEQPNDTTRATGLDPNVTGGQPDQGSPRSHSPHP